MDKVKQFTVGGFTGTKAQISRHFGIENTKFKGRIKNGWSIEESAGLVERRRG